MLNLLRLNLSPFFQDPEQPIDPIQNPSDPNGNPTYGLQPIPNGNGDLYDPATGKIYGPSGRTGGDTGATYDPATGIRTDPQGGKWTYNNGQWSLAPTPAPPGPAPSGGGPTNSPSSSGLIQPFTAPTPISFGGPNGLPNVPVFTPPQWVTPPAFQQPTPSDVYNDPSFAFRRDQGLGAINNSQAAQGLWATGETGKALQDYASNFASQEYGNIYNRALQSYLTNVNTQYTAPYEAKFAAAQAQFAPEMTQYTTEANYLQNQNQLNYENAYQKWLSDFNQRYGVANLQFQVAGA